MKGILACVLLSLLAVFGCKQQTEEASKDIIVSVNNETLSRNELEISIPNGLLKQDSIIAAENYIRFWIQEALMYDVANKNIADKEEIDRLVRNYRHSLIIYRYQEQLVQENLSKNISNEEINRFYEENKSNFKLDVSLVKGILLKIPIDAPQISDVREWYQLKKPKDVESLDKYIVKNAVSYDDFRDHWIDLESINEKLPKKELNASSLQRKFIEQQDSSFYYFLNVQAYLLPGNSEPEEYAKAYIKEILINQKKKDFLKNVENDLYNSALKKEKIKFHKK